MKGEDLWEKGMIGIVEYNEIEDSYQLKQRYMNWGLYPLWENYEGKKVRITIEILKGEKEY